MKIYLTSFLLFLYAAASAQVKLPLELNNYDSLTSYNQLVYFIDEIKTSPKIKTEIIGKSGGGYIIPVLLISDGEFGNDKSKIKVMISAQQHGNEPSGKEGALLLLKDIYEGKLDTLFEKIDLAIVPLLNPDGAEKNERRNSNKEDLNRNHLTLSQPETEALHKFFNNYLFEVTLDVHEYYPYDGEWQEFGYIKNFNEQIGAATNPNVAFEIREMQNKEALPFIKKYLSERDFTFNNYILEGPPNKSRMRHSTVDINDGRQSFAILNSLSFIMEGLNGKDRSADNIKRRAEGQAAGMKALLEYSYKNINEIMKTVNRARAKLKHSRAGEEVAIRMEHIKGNDTLTFNLSSLYSGEDSLITVIEYHSVVAPILIINKPAAYLIPKADSLLLKWMKKHEIEYKNYVPDDRQIIKVYDVSITDSIVLEGVPIPNINTEKKDFADMYPREGYYFVPINQLHSNLLVLALEPRSMIGLVTYKEYKYLLKGNSYPVLRVEN